MKEITIIFPEPNTMGWLRLLLFADDIPDDIYMLMKDGRLMQAKKFFKGDQ